MSVAEAIEKATSSVFAWLAVTFLGGMLWVIRRVFTNQKQIEMLQHEIEMRDQRREDDRKALDDIRSDIRDVRSDIKKLFQRGRE